MPKNWPANIVERSHLLAEESLRKAIEDFIRQHQLPAEFHSVAEQYYLPLALWLLERQVSGQTLVVGISGGQGSGKSTLADFIRLVLSEQGAGCCALSLDDLYLTRAERQQLAQEVHPLLSTRGVPGTHDIKLGLETLSALCRADEHTLTPLPRFDKSVDERVPRASWPIFKGKADVVLLEGWCLGARPSASLQSPINSLEKSEDKFGIWRNFINQQLEGCYRELFNRMDITVMLRAPGMESILEWRKLQEQKLRERTGAGMGDEELVRFVQHYERISCNLIADMPGWADCVFVLGEDHLVKEFSLKAVLS
ncbi:phosphoribulokinase [Microbulbifer epialgicus]|uniref:Phosphoribulokinase n=1 Tax=Microbulbifer epialgicus TaxID=393907 RepID=A0ABV4NYW4_9GAMM